MRQLQETCAEGCPSVRLEGYWDARKDGSEAPISAYNYHLVS
jgi:hypothetical protein